jgi:hypothetical protein
MASDDMLFLLKIEHDKLLVDQATAIEVMKLLAGAQALTMSWELREKGVFPYKLVRESRDPHAQCSYVSPSEYAQIELNSDYKKPDTEF